MKAGGQQRGLKAGEPQPGLEPRWCPGGGAGGARGRLAGSGDGARWGAQGPADVDEEEDELNEKPWS